MRSSRAGQHLRKGSRVVADGAADRIGTIRRIVHALSVPYAVAIAVVQWDDGAAGESPIKALRRFKPAAPGPANYQYSDHDCGGPEACAGCSSFRHGVYDDGSGDLQALLIARRHADKTTGKARKGR